MPTLKIHIEMRRGLLVLAQGLVRFQFFGFQHLSSSQRQHVDSYLQGVEVEEVEDAPPEEPPVPLLDDELKLADSRFEAWKLVKLENAVAKWIFLRSFLYVAACWWNRFLFVVLAK